MTDASAYVELLDRIAEAIYRADNPPFGGRPLCENQEHYLALAVGVMDELGLKGGEF